MKITAPLWARIIVGLMGLALAVSSLIGGRFTPPYQRAIERWLCPTTPETLPLEWQC